MRGKTCIVSIASSYQGFEALLTQRKTSVPMEKNYFHVFNPKLSVQNPDPALKIRYLPLLYKKEEFYGIFKT
jgi:hypothetical protein